MRISFNKQRRLWWAISLVAILAGVAAMAISWTRFDAPLRPGLDFVGGTRLQLELDCSIEGNCAEPINVAQVRDILAEENLANSTIQVVGDNKQILSIRTKTLDVNERTALQSALTEEIGQFNRESIQIDTVGPSVGEDLLVSGLLALIVSFFGIIVYLSFRFQFDYAFLAIVALFHDVLVTAGFFAILGLVAGVEVDSLFIVALLTIIGFSVNDTVVIYDRVRETIAERPNDNINEIVDDAVNQTLGRSINTTATTLLPIVAIFLFGGETLKFFALALIIGFLSGVYSSIFVASTMLSWWRERRQPEVKPSLAEVSASDEVS